MSKKALRARDYVEHLLEACERIQRYTAGKSEAEFLAETLLQDSVARNIETLGEASRQIRDVLPDATSRFPDIPFAAMYATRNLVAHGNLFVNYNVIWNVVGQDIPKLRTAVEHALAHWPADLT